MTFQTDAVYENGMLKPDQPLPLSEKQRVRITVEPGISRADRLYGLVACDPRLVDEVVSNPEFGILESP